MLQNHARKSLRSVDELEFDFEYQKKQRDPEITIGPEDGCFIYGLFLEGANFDD